MHDFLQRIEGEHPQRGLQRTGGIVLLPLPREEPREAHRCLLVERLTLGLQPLLEGRGLVDVDACQQVARVDRRGLRERGGGALGHQPVERDDVDGAGLEAHRDLVDAQRTPGEHAPQARERLAQAVTRPRRRNVGPEQRGQLVAGLGVLSAAGEIRQQCRGLASRNGDGRTGVGVRGEPPKERQHEPRHGQGM